MSPLDPGALLIFIYRLLPKETEVFKSMKDLLRSYPKLRALYAAPTTGAMQVAVEKVMCVQVLVKS